MSCRKLASELESQVSTQMALGKRFLAECYPQGRTFLRKLSLANRTGRTNEVGEPPVDKSVLEVSENELSNKNIKFASCDK